MTSHPSNSTALPGAAPKTQQAPALQPAQLEWSENAVPKSTAFDDYYYHSKNGAEESDYIYLQHNQLAERFAMRDTATFCIAETGFGTGLNFLKACQLWLNAAPSASQLHYIAFEQFPLSLTELTQAHGAFSELARLSEALINRYPHRIPGWQDVYLFAGKVRLTLWFGDALAGLKDTHAEVDAWFLDGFSPANNPTMWQPKLYQEMARLSHAGTTFASFTAAKEVRQGLEKVGFAVEKTKGFRLKREMIFGRLQQLRPHASKTPWFDLPSAINSEPNKKQVIVIGAGLSGAACAYRLAESGWQVTVLESEPQVAQQASSNLAGAIHPLVTADWNLRSAFYLQGLQATLRWLSPWFAANDIEGELNGLMQLAVDDTMQQRLQDSIRRVNLPQPFAHWLDAQQASELIGQVTDFSGMFFPQGGWVKPSSVVKKCLQHPNITVALNSGVSAIEAQPQNKAPKWQVKTTEKPYVADIVIVATGALSATLNEQLGLPIRPVKGQVSHFHAEQVSPLHTTVTHGGYSVVANFGEQVGGISGATFEAPCLKKAASAEANADNIHMAKQALPNWLTKGSSVDAVAANVAFRPTAPDHLPIVGAVADNDWMQQAYLTQSHTHAVYRYDSQRYRKGLYVSNGHGARGLMSVFWAADYLANLINGQCAEVSFKLSHAVHPARFAIRSWRSGKKAIS